MWACRCMNSGNNFILGSNFYLKNPYGGCGWGGTGVQAVDGEVDVEGTSLGPLFSL